MNDRPTDPIRFSLPPRKPQEKRKLGKGLGALMGEAQREEPLIRNSSERGSSRDGAPSRSRVDAKAAANGVSSLPIASIEPLPGQPRKHFGEAALSELADSIASRGVIQPIIVRALAGGRYQLVAGERRWRAAQKAKLHEIPALVRELDEREVLALALIENIQREDLSPVEEARAYRRLSDEQDMTQAQIAKLVDKSRSHVANLQRLLALPDEVLDMVEAERLSMGHARALIGHDDAIELAKRAVEDGLTVRDVERLARGGVTLGEAKARRTARPANREAGNADIAAVQRHLEEFIGLTVQIKPDTDPKSGAITIKYNTLDQLDMLCQRLTGGDI